MYNNDYSQMNLQEQQDLDIIDIVTLTSLFLQIQDREKRIFNEQEIQGMKSLLYRMDKKLDMIMELISNGSRNN